MTLVHVVQGRMAEATLKATGRGEVIGVADDLTYGRCSFSPFRHAALRRSFWEAEAANGPGTRWQSPDRTERAGVQVFSANDLGKRLARVVNEHRVVLWVSDHWREMLFACWAADALHRLRVAGERVLVGRSPNRGQPVAWMTEKDFAQATERAQPARPEWMAGAISIWQSYCRSPDQVERLRSSRAPVLPRFVSASRHYADLLPREGPHSRPMLSRFDETVLRALSATQWRGYPELFREPNSRLSRFVNVYGDLPVVRVWRWSQHHRGSFVERARVESAHEANPRFRLTEAGVDLLRNGLTRLMDAPPLWVGGHSAYGGARPWLVVGRGASWRVKRGPRMRRLRRRP